MYFHGMSNTWIIKPLNVLPKHDVSSVVLHTQVLRNGRGKQILKETIFILFPTFSEHDFGLFDSTSQPNEYEQFLQHTYNIFLRGLEREEYKQENQLTVSPKARLSIVLESYKKNLDLIHVAYLKNSSTYFIMYMYILCSFLTSKGLCAVLRIFHPEIKVL